METFENEMKEYEKLEKLLSNGYKGYMEGEQKLGVPQLAPIDLSAMYSQD